MTRIARRHLAHPWRAGLSLGAMALLFGAAGPAAAQQRHDPAAAIAAQREAMQALAAMDGVWRGPAWVIGAGGVRKAITQTERIGPFLDGSLKLIEGRGYEADGSVGFRAFGVVSFDPPTGAYRLSSHAQGQSGSFEFVPTPEGYRWSIPIPGATIRYTAFIAGGELHEIGERVVDGQPPQRIFEMRLQRVGDTDWPQAGTLAPR